MVSRRIGVEERRARLAVRHHLHPGSRAASPVEAARDQMGLHTSDPATPFLSSWARVDGLTIPDMETHLYDDPSLFRILGMRRTLFAVSHDLVPLLHHGCALALAAPEQRRLVGYLEAEGITDDGNRWLEEVGNSTVEAIIRRGEALATELREDVPELKQTLTFGRGKKWGGKVGVSTRVLFLLATQGRIIRGRPRGTWRSGQYRWAAMDSRLPGGIPDVDPATARALIVQRWLRSYGPGTEADLRWWTGWTLRNLRPALASLDLVEVEVDTGPAWIMADDLQPVPTPAPWAALLPGLDPTVMGWRERHWYLGDRWEGIFDRNGNAGPTVWWCGRVVGGWGQRPDGAVVYRLTEDIGADGDTAVAERAEALEAWLSGVRVTPRFPTPLFRDLSR
ncbi:MAG: AlkZ family DNA glycosylase [Actinomycetia bacterium]|nr:AlkZ family DNA glycosylase [Actinomycetes bacterium]